MAAEDTIFDRRANQVTRAVLIRGNESTVTPPVLTDFLLLPATVGELLMRHERLCFSVYGENLIAPILLRVFGPTGLLDLLEQGALRFALQSNLITHLASELPGVNPLQYGRLTSKVHIDPDESVADGLRRMSAQPDEATLARLQRALADAYVPDTVDYARPAVELAHQGYTLGRFKELGLPPERDLGSLAAQERATLARLASELHDLAFLSDQKMETLDEFVIAKVCDDSITRLTQGKKVATAEARLFEIENVPSFGALFVQNALTLSELPKLRQHPDAIRFRKWLRTASASSDASDIGRAYLDAISHRSGFLNSTTGKVTKTLALSAFSAVVGAFVAGPAGAAVGGVAGSLVPPAVDTTIDLIDQFILGRVLEGWDPRNYFDKVVAPNVKKRESKE
jgi:hypothetical protein